VRDPVGVHVAVAVPLPLPGAEAVALGDAPGEKSAVADALTVDVALVVAEGVGDPVVMPVGVCEAVGVPVRLTIRSRSGG
jgi:hypothetical protein